MQSVCALHHLENRVTHSERALACLLVRLKLSRGMNPFTLIPTRCCCRRRPAAGECGAQLLLMVVRWLCQYSNHPLSPLPLSLPLSPRNTRM
jgi:hypothetical protein